MTAPARLLLLTLVAVLGAAPAALADTAISTSGGGVVLTGGAEGETYVAQNTGVGFAVTLTTGVLTGAAPAGCSTSGPPAKSLLCNATPSGLTLNAGGGADQVTVTNYGSDYSATELTVNGGAGDDKLISGPSGTLQESVQGGEDNDTFTGSDPSIDYFAAEPGNDTYTGGTRAAPESLPLGFDAARYQLQEAPDVYELESATAGNVSLDGVANDADGHGGTDNVGADIEWVEGGTGNDVLSAGAGAVRLTGGPGDDVITGSPGPDLLRGQAGSDQLNGLGGDDELRDGDVALPARLDTDPAPPPAGNDRVAGGDGDDLIAVGAGVDDVTGGAGTDTVYLARFEEQVITSPAGFQPRWVPITVTLDDQANDTDGDNVHTDVEDVDTSAVQFDADYAIGFGYGSLAYANDTVTGSAAVNRIETGPGNDTVDGGAGADVIRTESGDDKVKAADKYTDAIDCGDGADQADVDLPGTNPARADVLKGCETVTGTALGLEGGILPTPTPTPAVPTAPKVKLGGATTVKSKTFLKTYSIGVKVTTDQAASVAGELSTTQATISKVGALTVGSGKLGSGTGTRTVKLKVAKKFRKKLKRKLRTKKQRRKGITLSAVITVTNASGQVARSSRTIKIKG